MINKFSNVPLYSQLKNVIIGKIENGEFAEGTKIPSEEEFCDLYRISRPTVRQAITELTNSGYLFKEKGKGTFVARPKAAIDIRDYTGFTDSILDSQAPGQHNVVATQIVNSSEFKKLGEVFNISGQHKVDFAEIQYSILLNSEVLAVNTSYLPLNLFPTIIEDIKGKKPSYDILKGKYPFIPSKSKSSIEIIFTEPEDTQFLQVLPGQAIIRIENILYSKAGQAVEYVISKYRADKCRLTFENIK